MSKDKGQYWTTSKILQNKVIEFIKNKPDRILEPAVGRGDLILPVIDKYPMIKFDLYEIDKNIDFNQKLNKKNIHFGDFLTQKIDKKYSTIVGNPPYVKCKGQKNLYLKFIEKCFNLLADGGELIFIIPSDFFKLTSARNIIKEMYNNGSFTDIYHPHNERFFTNASIDIIIFRYEKNSLLLNDNRIVKYNGIDKKLLLINDYIVFTNNDIKKICKIGDIFNVYVGMVSGRDSIYCNDKIGNINILTGKNIRKRYIFIDTFPSEYRDINNHLSQNKKELLNRKIRKFNEKNWYEWGAPRNINVIENNLGKKCIYVNTLARSDIIAFTGKVEYFNGNLLLLLPKNKISKTILKHITEYLNSKDFKSDFMYSGRFKIGQRLLENSFIPENILH